MLPFIRLVQSETPFLATGKIVPAQVEGVPLLLLGLSAELLLEAGEAGEAGVCLQLGLHGPQVASAQGPLTHLAVREGGHFWGTVLGKAKGNPVAASPKLSWGGRAASFQVSQAWPVQRVPRWCFGRMDL